MDRNDPTNEGLFNPYKETQDLEAQNFDDYEDEIRYPEFFKTI